MDYQVDPRNSDITRKLDGPVVVMCDLWEECISSVLRGTSRVLAAEKVATEKTATTTRTTTVFPLSPMVTV